MVDWVDVGAADDLAKAGVSRCVTPKARLAVSFRDGTFGAIASACNHAGGPLRQGHLDGERVVCPWHQWRFHRCNGHGATAEQGNVQSYPVKVEDGRVLVDVGTATSRVGSKRAPHPLARPVERAPGPLRLAGISTTAMDPDNRRFSGSDHLLGIALDSARSAGAETQMIRLDDLKFHACRGYYSKAAGACTWPCSITQMHADDELTPVYEALVYWADAIVVATLIRWGAASWLYFKMAERLNCIQNAITTKNKVLIKNKVAGFIIVGGQDNIQSVAGQMICFFAELGFLFPQFPYIAHSRGWSHEDMENNVEHVRTSPEIAEGARELAERCLAYAQQLLDSEGTPDSIARGGRKANH
ncbi:MAG: Rieske 2Fe-2S domain-containing protein [Alphaproteobacteria bacterium]|nr:Rieske 2Fe-2S domain-containing protein [Alphaproteobacteria bacterium]